MRELGAAVEDGVFGDSLQEAGGFPGVLWKTGVQCRGWAGVDYVGLEGIDMLEGSGCGNGSSEGGLVNLQQSWRFLKELGQLWGDGVFGGSLQEAGDFLGALWYTGVQCRD